MWERGGWYERGGRYSPPYERGGRYSPYERHERGSRHERHTGERAA